MNIQLGFALFVLLTTVTLVSAQPSKLAQEYFGNGEYEKAALLYEQLFNENAYSDFYFSRYLECLVLLERFKDGEKLLKDRIKQFPEKTQLYVDYGNLLEQQFRSEEADKMYEEAINRLPEEQYQIIRLANAFIQLTKNDLALKTYERGQKLLKDKNLFAYELGDLYRRIGNTSPMVENYLNALNENESRISSMKTLFQRYFTEDDFKELQVQLYDRIQQDPKNEVYPEMLTWVFIQNKDYKNALRQVKATDRRMKENGGRVFRLAQTAANDSDFNTAIEAYNYIIEEKGETNTYYLEAKREILKSKRLQLIAGYNYTKNDLLVIEKEYEGFLDEFGRNKNTASILLELAELEAIYLNNLDKSIELLEALINYPDIQPQLQAESKLALADYYLIQGERWEATLLYSQVDKDFQDDVLGQTARFKNAKLAYYTGDFQWAQAQFSILKASTSKLIANDALDLSVFIMDNLGLDTTVAPMYMYASADLLAFQNKFDRAFSLLDSISILYPNHSLEDDILYTKAKIYLKRQRLDDAVAMFNKIIEGYPESIRVDNALFDLADLYEQHLKQPEKAQELYKRIITDYSNSTFAVEARKRFRRLRGDVQ